MKDFIRSSRFHYSSGQLDEKNVNKNPIIQFENWMEEAIDKKLPEPHTMILSTASKTGRPSGRVLLLRDFSEKGFIFYTNYKSRKGEEINQNPWASLTFFWQQLERQVRIEGKLAKLSSKESDDYFNSRPFESRIGAIASNQSKIIESRKELDNNYEMLLKKYSTKNVPRPVHWGGYCLKPLCIEFWQGRTNRLHDRILFTRKNVNEKWKVQRLAP